MRASWDRYWAEAIEPRFFLLRQLAAAGRNLVAGLAVMNVVLGLLPVAFVIATSFLVGRAPAAVAGGLDSPAWDNLVDAFLWASAAFFAQQLLNPAQAAVGAVLKHRVDGQSFDRLMDVSLRSTGIGSLEDQDNLDSLQQATQGLERGWQTPGDAAVGTLSLIVRYSRLIAFGIVIGLVVSWWAAAALCTATMIFRYGHRSALRIRMRLWPQITRAVRETEYFRGVGLGAPSAKELRVFGMIDWVIARYRTSHLSYLRRMWKVRRHANINRFLWFTAVGLVISTIVLALLLRSAARGELTLTELTLAMQATLAVLLLGEFYHESDDATSFGMLAARAVDDVETRLADFVSSDRHADADGDAGGLPVEGVRFDNVSFAYPGSDALVLDDLNLTLRAGECTALVGLNGAGKTTLVKLLGRLYEPTSGTVRVDGRDVREFAVDSWRRQLGVIFQDFNRYELSVADNITFGAIEHTADPDAVPRAAAGSGMTGAIAQLPRGIHTTLARHFDDGAELSGGQWQRIAIARALYAVDAGARVLVLDEPTAALDVRAEAEFFDDFAARTRGVTTLLISHRFSSVRHADRIVVLEHGRVIEEGTHESLVADGGRYAELFELQAQRFQTAGEATG